MALSTVSDTQLIDSYQWRYAVKRFDPSKQIDAATWSAIEKSLVLTPSSFGLQPWKFLVVRSTVVKAKLPAISWNQTQPGDCSHMVVLAARKTVDEAYVDAFITKAAQMRGVTSEALVGYRNVIVGFLKNTTGRHFAWSSNQAYIALGQLLASAAMLGVDACPMEGIVASEYDKLLGLEGSDYATVVGCALGYRHPEDHYASMAKVRFDASDVLQYL
ncbi:MAG: NAD(P)H-dependent oxidoreductase [Planctomycetota bacterium]|nr:NAD(P)H-dependent oxidoreductase [Planctomycetota bacterium]